MLLGPFRVHAQHQIAAATGKQQLMVWVLKYQSRFGAAGNASTLWFKKSGNQAEQGAFAASITAHQHPQTWARNDQVAAIEGLLTIRPAVAYCLNA